MLRALTRRYLFHDTERAVAAWIAVHANWSEDQRAEISEFLSKMVDRAATARKPGRFALRWLGRSMLLSVAVVIGIVNLSRGMFTYHGVLDYWYGILALSGILTLLGSVVSGPLSIWFDNRRALRAVPMVEMLGKYGQSAAVGSLARASMHSPLRKSASLALVQIASRLRPEDYGTLPAQTVPALCSALERADRDTGLTVLRVLAVVGDERAIYAVEFAAYNNASQEVRNAALALIPILNKRANESRTSSTLLRASAAAPQADNTLLRATLEPTDPHADQLLRGTIE
jgi:hypothetical protein